MLQHYKVGSGFVSRCVENKKDTGSTGYADNLYDTSLFITKLGAGFN